MGKKICGFTWYLNGQPGVVNWGPGFFMDNNDMKKHLVLYSVSFLVCFLPTVCAAAGPTPSDEPISLNIEEQPLGEVLAMITKMTGNAFIIDDQWIDMTVSISVEAKPLHKVLKSILSDLNSAIIYRSDGEIKIIIYGETAEPDEAAASQRAESEPESASMPTAEQESTSSEEAAPEPGTDNSADRAEEGSPQPDEEKESVEEQSEKTAGETSEEQEESTENAPDN
jgi:hypothetical protein